MPVHKFEIQELVSNEAIKLGFIDIGFSKVRYAAECEKPLNKWLADGYNADMSYMERNHAKRLNPSLLVEGSKTVISLLYNYFSNDCLTGSELKIAKYAYGDDYHDVIKEKLHSLSSFISTRFGEHNYRCFVDSAPVLERFWAQNSGLGWIGKNGCLISRKHGSFVFIAEIITSLEINCTDIPPKDYCGTCRKCIDACPTQAVTDKRTVNSNKCISYQTIENHGEIPEVLKGKFENYIFGCDICQDVCPWNSKAMPHSEALFTLKNEIQTMTMDDWQNIDEEPFGKIFQKSAIKRTKFKGLQRNIRFINPGKPD